jgi:hypothetical protein
MRKRASGTKLGPATKVRQSSQVLPKVAESAEGVPQVFEVVVVCRHEDEQRAVYERMRGEGFRCRVLTL